MRTSRRLVKKFIRTDTVTIETWKAKKKKRSAFCVRLATVRGVIFRSDRTIGDGRERGGSTRCWR